MHIRFIYRASWTAYIYWLFSSQISVYWPSFNVETVTVPVDAQGKIENIIDRFLCIIQHYALVHFPPASAETGVAIIDHQQATGENDDTDKFVFNRELWSETSVNARPYSLYDNHISYNKISSLEDSGMFLLLAVECDYFGLGLCFDITDIPMLRENVAYYILNTEFPIDE